MDGAPFFAKGSRDAAAAAAGRTPGKDDHVLDKFHCCRRLWIRRTISQSCPTLQDRIIVEILPVEGKTGMLQAVEQSTAVARSNHAVWH